MTEVKNEIHFYRQIGSRWIESETDADPRDYMDHRIFEFRTLYTAAPASLGEAKAVAPEGWKLVPIEPTKEMIRAADKLPESFSIGDEYKSMFDAAP